MTTDHDLTAVLATNARALRGSARIDDVVRAARRYDAGWNTSRIWSIEHGKTPVIVDGTGRAAALTTAPHRPHPRTCSLSDNFIAITDGLTRSAACWLRSCAANGPGSDCEPRVRRRLQRA